MWNSCADRFVSVISTASLLRGSDLTSLDLVEQIQGLCCNTRVPLVVFLDVDIGNGVYKSRTGGADWGCWRVLWVFGVRGFMERTSSECFADMLVGLTLSLFYTSSSKVIVHVWWWSTMPAHFRFILLSHDTLTIWRSSMSLRDWSLWVWMYSRSTLLHGTWRQGLRRHIYHVRDRSVPSWQVRGRLRLRYVQRHDHIISWYEREWENLLCPLLFLALFPCRFVSFCCLLASAATCIMSEPLLLLLPLCLCPQHSKAAVPTVIWKGLARCPCPCHFPISNLIAIPFCHSMYTS